MKSGEATTGYSTDGIKLTGIAGNILSATLPFDRMTIRMKSNVLPSPFVSYP